MVSSMHVCTENTDLGSDWQLQYVLARPIVKLQPPPKKKFTVSGGTRAMFSVWLHDSKHIQEKYISLSATLSLLFIFMLSREKKHINTLHQI